MTRKQSNIRFEKRIVENVEKLFESIVLKLFISAFLTFTIYNVYTL